MYQKHVPPFQSHQKGGNCVKKEDRFSHDIW